MNEYEIVAEHLLDEDWEQLFFVMIRTPDDLLRKKIECYLQQYTSYYHPKTIQEAYNTLFTYLYHAQNNTRRTI